MSSAIVDCMLWTFSLIRLPASNGTPMTQLLGEVRIELVLLALKRPASARVRLSHPLFSGPSLPSPAPVFDFRAQFCHSALMETRAFGFRHRPKPPRAKSDFLSVGRRLRTLGGTKSHFASLAIRRSEERNCGALPVLGECSQ